MRAFLEQDSGIKVICTAESGEEAYQRYSECKPDVLLIKISMPGMGGDGSLKTYP
jgi:DNA-binding NarL/FixJ family response regulator